MTAIPTWFGPSDRALFGWLHRTDDGRSRGIAVMCGPLGHEEPSAQPAFRRLCERLADAGIASLRFAYDGTGDSAGALDDPGRLAAWTASVDHAVAFGRKACPGPVLLVGMRMGALLAAEAVGRGTVVDGLVQWDPYRSGRAYLRTEQVLLASGYGAAQEEDGTVEGPAFLLSEETATELSALRFDVRSASVPALVLTRAGSRDAAWFREAVAGSPAEWAEVTGQEELLDIPPDMLTVPDEAIGRIVDWTVRAAGGGADAICFEPVGSAVVATSPSGASVTERPVWLGPSPLFGMVAEPGATTTALTVVFLTAGALDHCGPGRLWTDLARRLALEGIRSVRIDIRGAGETPAGTSDGRQIPKPPEAIDDLADLAAALGSADGSGLVFVGLSSGGYHAIEAALHLRPAAVCAVNPGLASWVPDQDRGAIDPRRLAYRPMPRLLRRLSRRHRRVAGWTWTALLQLWVHRSPMDPVARAARRCDGVLVVMNEPDARQFEPSPYWSLARRRLARQGRFDLAVLPGGDHSLYTKGNRARAAAVLTEWLLAFARGR